MLLTRGFIDDARRLQHYGDHANDFGATDALQYERLADAVF